MARQTKKENMESAMNQPDVESTVPENAAETLAPEQDAPESPATPENPQPTEDANNERSIETPAIRDEDTPKEMEAEKPAGNLAVHTISVLADRHRVPSWQVAAMLRMMGWEADKMATEQEFAEAINMLQSRRIGGGRM